MALWEVHKRSEAELQGPFPLHVQLPGLPELASQDIHFRGGSQRRPLLPFQPSPDAWFPAQSSHSPKWVGTMTGAGAQLCSWTSPKPQPAAATLIPAAGMGHTWTDF